jgi:hypothetical protein
MLGRGGALSAAEVVASVRSQAGVPPYSDPRWLIEALGYQPCPDRAVQGVYRDGYYLVYSPRTERRKLGSQIYRTISMLLPAAGTARAIDIFHELVYPSSDRMPLAALTEQQQYATHRDCEAAFLARHGSGAYALVALEDSDPAPVSRR